MTEVVTNNSFRLYWSTNDPTYKPQKIDITVTIQYILPYKLGWKIVLEKYQGIEIMLMPCAKPEIELAANNK